MDIAVLADIHSNYIALEHCVNYALERNISTFIFLGDYIGEMAYPERTMKLIYEYRSKYDCHFISGNKEKYWLNYRDNGETNWSEYNSTTGALLYAYQHLTPKDLDFFESLPIAQDLTFEGLPTLTACHGSPRNVREQLIIYEAVSREILKASETDYILCGHTHIQGKYSLGRYSLEKYNLVKTFENSKDNTASHEKVILNPGSVGLPLESESSCQFLILHGENGRWTEEFININYDETEVISQLTESGLAKRAPYWCQITEELLRNHKNCPYGHAEVLNRAMELCRLDTGVCSWPDIPEKYWKTAMEEYFPQP